MAWTRGKRRHNLDAARGAGECEHDDPPHLVGGVAYVTVDDQPRVGLLGLPL